MRTSISPSYASLFMGALEGKMLNSSPHQTLIWLRYIDYIFLTWTQGSSSLNQFLTHASNFQPTIKFTSEISQLKILFLDVMITLKGGKLGQTYTLNLQTLLFISLKFMPPKPHQPYSLAFRLVRIRSTKEALTTRFA
ncbi:hypothetical protein ElyMa_000891200 [Elysia marginata]|uniref:Reverse transcriptase domain-containing protein n=1 Tax=Elysia marginata TaxID=1093978 RepID=A0AAV4H7F4_9GAST|nr:hypothetical protein ElyMa_000891200 [Elysia marginata]